MEYRSLWRRTILSRLSALRAVGERTAPKRYGLRLGWRGCFRVGATTRRRRPHDDRLSAGGCGSVRHALMRRRLLGRDVTVAFLARRCAEEPARLHAPLRFTNQFQKLKNLTLGDGISIVEALAVFAINRPEIAYVLIGLDTVDNNFSSKLVRQRRHRPQHAVSGSIRTASGQKRAINADGLEGQATEVKQ